MNVSRRKALSISGTVLTSLSLGMKPEHLLAEAARQAPQAAPPVPDHLADAALREMPVLPLKKDGSAQEYTAKDITPITDPLRWRNVKGEAPDIEHDYRKLKVKVTGGGSTKRAGMMSFADLDPLPRHSQITLLQCGAKDPHGIVKWTGVRFSEFARMLGLQPTAHYGRFIAADGMWSDEDVRTLMHPQVMLAWLMNDAPIPPKHGAPFRLVIPFRYGIRSVKALTEIAFSITVPAPPKPA